MESNSTPTDRDFDRDRKYARTTLWRVIKAGFGQFYRVDLLFRRLERLSRAPNSGAFNCPRENLVLAVFAFTSMTPEQRRDVQDRYFNWRAIIEMSKHVTHTTPPREPPEAEKLPPGEDRA